MKNLFDNIRRQSNRSIIEHLVGHALTTASTVDAAYLRRIQKADSLDEVWALCCEAQGDEVGAYCFREALAQRLAHIHQAAAQALLLNPVFATRPVFK